MPTLTHRRDPGTREESWRVFYVDIHVGTIGMRAGVPNSLDQWGWACGFYPVSYGGLLEHGTASDFFKARAAFETSWKPILPKVTQQDFIQHRRHRAWTAWRQDMWEKKLQASSTAA
jgi:hypothetical protein